MLVPKPQPQEILEAVFQEGVKIPRFQGRAVAGQGPEKQQFLPQGVGQALGGIFNDGKTAFQGLYFRM